MTAKSVSFYLPVPTNFTAHICCPLSSFLPFLFPPPCKARRYQRNKTKQNKLFFWQVLLFSILFWREYLNRNSEETLYLIRLTLFSTYSDYWLTIRPPLWCSFAKKPKSLTDKANLQLTNSGKDQKGQLARLLWKCSSKAQPHCLQCLGEVKSKGMIIF